MDLPGGGSPGEPLGWSAAVGPQVLPRLYPLAAEPSGDAVSREGTTLAAGDEPVTVESLPRLIDSLAPLAHSLPHAGEVLPGLVARLVRERPGVGSTPLGAGEIAALGGGDVALNLAVSNLRALAAPSVSDVVADSDRDDATVHQLRFDHFFGASKVLVLGELLSGMGVELPAHGVLLAVPTRQLVLLHVPRGEGMVPALRVMAKRSLALHDAGPARLSPHVFYAWPQEPVVQVTRFDEQGRVALQLSEGLRRTLIGLGLLPPAR